MAVSVPCALPLAAVARPAGPLVDSHVHLFSPDQKRFPFAPNATYKPAPAALEDYVRFAGQAKIDHAVIVHPEPYQDDYRYLEYCFAHEPAKGFFKGTCLFDPISKDTPDRLAALVGNNPGRIVALRIHETRKPGAPPLVTGPIKDRDLKAPGMKSTWRRCHQLHLAIQMHFLPYYATEIFGLAQQFPEMPVILDHLGRGGEGTPEEFANVLKLAKLPRVYMKFANIASSSKQKYPYADVKPLVHKAYDAFGPQRMIWGYFGHDASGAEGGFSMAAFGKDLELFEQMFDFAKEEDRQLIRGGNALKLYGWS
jgi:predicted TIM-barrel fold metal-dependent hydrolase